MMVRYILVLIALAGGLKSFGQSFNEVRFQKPFQYQTNRYFYSVNNSPFHGYLFQQNTNVVNDYYLDHNLTFDYSVPTVERKANTNLFYQTIGSTGQFLDIRHDQNLSEHAWFSGFLENYSYTTGTTNAQSNPLSFQGQVILRPDSTPWEFDFGSRYIRYDVKENWGLTDATNYQSGNYFDLASLSMYNSDAWSYNRLKELDARVGYVKDSVVFRLTAHYREKILNYGDPSYSFSQYPGYDSLGISSIDDYLRLKQMGAGGEVEKRMRQGTASAFIKGTALQYQEFTGGWYFDGGVRWNGETEKWKSAALAQYTYGNYNDGAIRSFVKFEQVADSAKMLMGFGATYSQVDAALNEILVEATLAEDYNYLMQKSNASVYGELKFPKIHSVIKASGNMFRGNTYLGDHGVAQDSSTMIGGQLTANTTIPFGKGYLRITGGWQKYSAREYVAVPEWFTYSELGVHLKLFSGALQLKTGVSVFATAKHDMVVFNPMYRMTGYGGAMGEAPVYPFLDYFIRANIKRTMVNIRLAHVNSGLMASEALVNGLPAGPFEVRVSLNWRFTD